LRGAVATKQSHQSGRIITRDCHVRKLTRSDGLFKETARELPSLRGTKQSLGVKRETATLASSLAVTDFLKKLPLIHNKTKGQAFFIR